MIDEKIKAFKELIGALNNASDVETLAYALSLSQFKDNVEFNEKEEKVIITVPVKVFDYQPSVERIPYNPITYPLTSPYDPVTYKTPDYNPNNWRVICDGSQNISITSSTFNSEKK